MLIAVADGHAEGAMLERQLRHDLELELGVGRETVHCNHRVEPELLHDPQVSGEILGSALERRNPTVGISAVALQSLSRGDQNDCSRREPAGAADDVDELLEAEVAGEAAFSDDVVGELEADQVADQRAVPVGDVREGAGMDEGRLTLERLDEVRLERVLEEHGHRTGDLEVFGRHG